jgi:hypothetical protein
MISATVDPYELGHRDGAESAAREPLTEEQQRKVRTMLRLADTETPPAKAS